jgi:PAS domain S-box-containing protein
MPASTDRWDRHRDTLDNLLEGFQIIGADWTYLYVNPAAARHGQRTPRELVGRTMPEAYPGIEQTETFRMLRRCMTDREPASFETLFTFPDGSSRWFEVRVEPVPEGLCVHSVDIHARKTAEIALREQESVATLGQMAAVVAHEIKNPLAGLSGALQLLKGRHAPGDSELPVFDEMLACIDTLDRLVRDLLIFARPVALDARALPIVDVVRDSLLVLEDDESLKRHVVRQSVEAAGLLVWGDRELLKNAFRNLILNAAQSMPEAGAIDLRVVRDGRECLVTVSDTGPGIPPHLSTRIFEPFVSGRRGGTGLGLPISRRIVRLHGGDLRLVPTSAPGATFLVTLPLGA